MTFDKVKKMHDKQSTTNRKVENAMCDHGMLFFK